MSNRRKGIQGTRYSVADIVCIIAIVAMIGILIWSIKYAANFI